MSDRCAFAADGGCWPVGSVVADLEYKIPILGESGSLPLCAVHAARPYLMATFMRQILGKKAAVRLKVVPREPFASLLGVKGGRKKAVKAGRKKSRKRK